MKSAGPYLHVQWLQDDAAVAAPIFLQAQDQVLESLRGHSGVHKSLLLDYTRDGPGIISRAFTVSPKFMPADSQSFRDRLVPPLLVVGLELLRLLPLQRARGLGRWLGRLLYRFDGRSRRVTERNIALAYPNLSPVEQRQLVSSSLEETGALAAEMGHVWRAPWPQTAELIESVTGADAIAETLTAGSGVIILAPHLGNWEIVGLHLATLGDTVALFEPPKITGLGPIIQRARERSGSRLVPTDARGLAALVRCVRAGGISGILPDQVPAEPSGGRNVPFMGVSCGTPSLACKMIRRTRARAFVGVAYRTVKGFRVVYSKAPEAVYGADEELALTAMNQAVADHIAGESTQYQWSYKRFRTRPFDGLDHYRELKVPRRRFQIKPEPSQ